MFHGLCYEMVNWRSGPCVYFLIDGDRVVYVGKSAKLVTRLVEHMQDKRFDRVLYLRQPKSDLSRVESALIRYLKPRYNVLEVSSGDATENRELVKKVAKRTKKRARKGRK